MAYPTKTSTAIRPYRPGATGALLDIYEQAIFHLKQTIEAIPDDALTVITDVKTADENCHSIQTILTHVVHSGYGYAISINNLKGHRAQRPGKTFYTTIQAYVNELDNVLTYTENVFKNIADHELEQTNDSLKIKTSWGQLYDIEQLMEHAIVHILRHQRQIEKIKTAGLIAAGLDEVD